MGACDFYNDTKTDKPVGEAFHEVVQQALWEHGHGGYSGTIAEKDSFVLVDLPAGMEAYRFKAVLSDLSYNWNDEGTDFKIADADEDVKAVYASTPLPRLREIVRLNDDKWGPALAVKTPNGWAFFGYASS